MHKVRKLAGRALLVVMCLLSASVIIQGSDDPIYRLLESKSDQVQRAERAKPYNDAVAEELRLLQKKYATADDAHKKAIADIILHRSVVTNDDKLPADLKSFIRELEHARDIRLNWNALVVTSS